MAVSVYLVRIITTPGGRWGWKFWFLQENEEMKAGKEKTGLDKWLLLFWEAIFIIWVFQQFGGDTPLFYLIYISASAICGALVWALMICLKTGNWEFDNSILFGGVNK